MEISLTQNKIALIDDEDLDLVSEYTWCAHKAKQTYYAYTPEGLKMHRLIIDAPKEMQVDHKNGDGLDNRKENLRVCTNQQNSYNKRKVKGKSKYKGVSIYDKLKNKYRAKIVVDNTTFHLGYFLFEEDAAKAYDKAAIKYFGEFAKLNFERDCQSGEEFV